MSVALNHLNVESTIKLNPARILLLFSLIGCAAMHAAASAPADAPSTENAPVETGRQIEAQPDSVRKYRFLAKASREQRDFATAASYYQKVLTYSPDDQKAAYFLGTCLVRERRQTAAKAAFLLSSQLDSVHVNTNLALTQIFLSEEKPDSARRFLSRAMLAGRGRDRGLELRRQLADQYRRKGNIAAAIEQYRMLAEVDSPAGQDTTRERADLLKMIADLHRESGMISEALLWQQRLLDHHEAGTNASATKQPSADRISILNDLADLQAAAGSEEAYGTLAALVEVDPGNRYAYYERLLVIATQRNDGPRHLQALEGMVRANPKDIPTLAALVEFHLDRKVPAQAERWLQQGLSVAPEHGRLHILMGDLLAARGDLEDALKSFEKALKDPEWEVVAQQRVWQIRPPETAEEKLKREFFGRDDDPDEGGGH
jgi:tetratricopeptide (TPR) repeat protein